MNQDPRVDVFGIGSQRSGSTWVFRALDDHPEVTTADVTNNKELNFFNFNYEKGYDWYHELYDQRRSPCLDFSILYWNQPGVPERINRYNPESRFILCLRDPIERAFSQHKLQIRRNRLPENHRSFGSALERNPTYLEQGRYATNLKRYLEFFDTDSIHIILFEEIAEQPESTLRGLYDFLDVDADFQPAHLEEKTNRSKLFRSESLKELRFGIAKSLRTLLGEWSVRTVKATRIPALLKTLNAQPPEDSIDPPDPDTVHRLRREFLPEVRELEELTGRDLSHWLHPTVDPAD